MDVETWLIYLIAISGLSLSPGPNGLLALTHGALYGYRRALFTIIGGVFGFVILFALAMFGIGAILEASVDLLSLMRWIGGLYLIWLGIQLWRSPPIALDEASVTRSVSSLTLFRQGLLSALSNPKVILFFAAFLPQFIDSGRHLRTQFVIMAGTFAIVEFLVEYVLARTSHQLRPWLERNGQIFNRSCGGLFVVIGASLPLTR